MMYPNTNYLKYFPDAEIPETKNISDRSGVLKAGPYLAIKKVAEDYHLDDMLADIIGEDSGLFLDLAAYSISEPEFRTGVSHQKYYSTVLLT